MNVTEEMIVAGQYALQRVRYARALQLVNGVKLDGSGQMREDAEACLRAALSSEEQVEGESSREAINTSEHPTTTREWEVERLREAVTGIDDDFMTSEVHHPGYVLIPTAKFEAIRSALSQGESR